MKKITAILALGFVFTLGTHSLAQNQNSAAKAAQSETNSDGSLLYGIGSGLLIGSAYLVFSLGLRRKAIKKA